jgi:hypothetical protein
MTDVLLVRLAAAQPMLLQLEGLTRFQWLERLLSPVVQETSLVTRMCHAARQRVNAAASDLEFQREPLVAMLPDAASAEQRALVSRVVYAASQAHTKRNDSTVQYLAYLDSDMASLALGSEETRSVLLPLLKWLQFSFSTGAIEQGMCEGVDLRTAGGGLLKSELELLGKQYAERGAIVWFYSLAPVLQRAICDVWVNKRNSTF